MNYTLKFISTLMIINKMIQKTEIEGATSPIVEDIDEQQGNLGAVMPEKVYTQE